MAAPERRVVDGAGAATEAERRELRETEAALGVRSATGAAS